MDPLQHFWEQVYQNNAPRLIGICRRYVGNRELAEDLVHDAFITAINKYSTYNGKGSFEGWLRAIVINTALMYLRREKKINISNFPSENGIIEDGFQNPDSEDIRYLIENAGFTDSDLLQAIDQLPDHHKAVFNLYVIDKYSHKQIASELNISEGTSKSHLARARKKLQTILYQRIMADKEKRKTKVAAFMPLTAKAHYIDRLFSNGLNSLAIKPLHNPQIVFSGINWNTMSKPSFFGKKAFFPSVRTIKYIILPVCIIITAICTVKYASPQKDAEFNGHMIQSDSIIKTNPSIVNDSSKILHIVSPKCADTLRTKKSLQSEKTDTAESQPVVVTKTIIQRQTVEVQKTIRIYDTTDAR